MTASQRRAIFALYRRSPDGAPNFWQFYTRFVCHPTLGCIGGQWCGMFVGIEADGYTHS